MELRNASLLPADLSLDDFSLCDYLPELQKVLFSTSELDESVTYKSLVVVPESINTTLYQQFGTELELTGSFVSFSMLDSIPPPLS